MKLLLLVLPLFLFCSCEKTPDIPVTPSECKLLTVNFDTDQNGFYNVLYNGNKIVQLTRETDVQTKWVYYFNSLNQLVKREEFTNVDNLGANLVRSRVEHIYDASNNLIRSNGYYQLYSGGVALGLMFNGFDSVQYINGNVAQLKGYSPYNGTDIYMGKTIFTWLNSDLTSITNFGQNGLVAETVNFTYDLTKENKFDSVLPYFYIQEIGEYGYPMEGIRRSKHILTSSTQKYANAAPVIRTYETTFNSKGYIKGIKENAFGRSAYIFRFTYTCD